MRRLLNIRPKGGSRIAMGLIPLLAIVILYIVASAARHADNPRDKVLPIPAAMAQGVEMMFLTVDPASGQIPVLEDTAASLKRLGWGLAIATAASLTLGMALGLLPMIRAAFGPLVATIAVIPPIAVLPILFIVMGLGEASKIALIVVGVAPVMVRDLAAHIGALPEEQLVKSQSLGSSTWQLMVRVALPQAMPRLIMALRLALGPAWVFLISAEAIASDVGLGYRIFLVRRYLAMDVIIPYVLWITLLAVIMDLALVQLSKRLYPWAHFGRND